MSTRGTHITIVIALIVAFFLPRRIECGYPGATCGHAGKWRTICTTFEVEPIGFYLIELLAKRDVGFAYSREDDCR